MILVKSRIYRANIFNSISYTLYNRIKYEVSTTTWNIIYDNIYWKLVQSNVNQNKQVLSIEVMVQLNKF